MRALIFLLSVAVASCAGPPETPGQLMPSETVRLEPAGELSLRAGDGAEDTGGFTFSIGYPNNATNLSTPDSVSWSIGFGTYCRDRPSWLQAVVIGPGGQVWRGYRVFVPPGPDRAQYWSSGGTGADAYGGPATPGLLEAATHGGKFILALEDDEGQRWNAVAIETLTPAERNRLFAEQPAAAPRESEMLLVVEAPAPPVRPGTRSCP